MSKKISILIIKSFLVFMSFTTIGRAEIDKSSVDNKYKKTPFETDASKGRDFSNLSFNPDGTELMFTECFDTSLISNQQKGKDRECRIFSLNMANHSLRHYEFPEQDKYNYTSGSFSPKGNFVVLRRAPRTDDSLPTEEYNQLARENSEKAEICIMNADGSNFKIIKTKPGLMVGPIMSNDETKIAYFRGKLRPPGSKTFAAGFDIYEIDLKAKTDELFAGPYEFYAIRQMQYLSRDGEILVGAYGPKRIKNMRQYDYNSIYQIKRGKNESIEPISFEGIVHIRTPFVTRDGTMFFYGSDSKRRISFFRKSKNGDIKQWVKRLEDLGYTQNEHSVISTPDEKKIFIIYSFDSGSELIPYDHTKNGIAFLNIETSKWHKFTIPEVVSSSVIPVTGFGLIEIRPSEYFNANILNFSSPTTKTNR